MKQQILRFGVVGGIGFLVDGGLLWLMLQAGGDFYLSRALSFPLAVLVTWQLNRHWTFDGGASARPGRQLNRYLAVQITGALSNYLVYSAYLAAVGESLTAAAIGFALGAAVGMVINFFGSRQFAFHPGRS